MDDGTQSPQLRRIDEIADEFGLKPRYVRQLVHDRAIGHYRPGKLILIDRVEFNRWLADNRVEAI